LTSATDVAGKSIVAANITASIAATGKKVVLVRRGRHAQSVDPAHQPEAAAANRQALDRTWLDGVPGVSISMLPATSESSAATLQALRKVLLEADRSALTVIDGDSVLAHEATPLVADVAGLTLLVVDRRHETADEVEAAVSALAHLDGRLLGCVLVDPGKSGPLDRFRRRDDA
jgi:Mrp family chromosome partitioning ATPase